MLGHSGSLRPEIARTAGASGIGKNTVDGTDDPIAISLVGLRPFIKRTLIFILRSIMHASWMGNRERF
jgi:hypothetical protein